MKLHLPVPLFRSLLTCMAMVVFVTLDSVPFTCYAAAEYDEENELLMLLSVQDYPNGSKIYTTRQTSALTLTGYESVSFLNISRCAIYNNGTFSLNGNGTLTFSGNTVASNVYYNLPQYSGGAIDNSGDFSLCGNEEVNFSKNSGPSDFFASPDGCGGAIFNSGTFTLSDNGMVTFSENTSSTMFNGGAIYNMGTFVLNGNKVVSFSGNSAFSADNGVGSYNGGAILNEIESTFWLSGNGAVTFRGNSASEGGAISNYGTFILSENEDVAFNGNTAIPGNRRTGAIYNWATFTLSGNRDVTFSGNTSSGSGYGGAIFNSGTFTLSENRNLIFSGNMTSESSFFGYGDGGGAICNSGGIFTLSNNEDVLFEKNVEIEGENYRLRSIYSYGILNLSASKDHSITFRDSVHASGFFLDSGYAEGTMYLNQNGTGDIIFTGATTEADLREMKGADGTEAEILRSQTSQFLADVMLAGGRLQVQDGAKLTFCGLSIGSDTQSASLVLHNGRVDTSLSLTLSTGASLSLSGSNYLLSSGVVAEGNNTLSLTLGEENRQQAALTIGGSLQNVGNLTIQLGDIRGLKGSNYHLLHVIGNADGWDKATIQMTGGQVGVLTWVGGDLYYRYDAAQLQPQPRADKTITQRLTVGGVEMLSMNEALVFSGASSGITNNKRDYTAIIDNGEVSFIGNTYTSTGFAYGGAIFNERESTFTLSGNGAVTFNGNTAFSSDGSARGGAISNWESVFTLSNNGDVLFEKNVEIEGDTYRLRSIYSNGILNLSASKGHSITFRDSVYANETVNLNPNGTGDIIFTGATTEADLREMKGEEGTEAEILRSQTSQFFANVTLEGGRLQVQDGAKLTFCGLSIGSDTQSASLVLHDGWVDTSLLLTLSTGSSLLLSGSNYLLCSRVVAEGNNTLSLTLGEENRQQAALTIGGSLQNVGNLTIRLGDVCGLTGSNYHLLHVIGDADGWDKATIQMTGGQVGALTWVGGDLYYRYDAAQLQPQPRADKTITQRLTVGGFEMLSMNETLVFDGSASGITNKGDYAAIIDNGEVFFIGNEHSSNIPSGGGAICNDEDSSFTLSGNGTVIFTGNIAFSFYSSYGGGAIYNAGMVTLSDNGNVTFSGNSDSSDHGNGGAIFNSGTFTLSGNGDVSFRGNMVSSDGGAIYSYGTFTLSGNRDVSFNGNTASNGGAIYNGGTFTLSGNGDVSFRGNTTSAGSSYGAVIDNRGTFTLCGNGNVTFSGNKLTFSSYTYYGGGAIYNHGSFTLSNNDDVLFEKNAEIEGENYRLRSIYSKEILNLSASKGHAITFRDSLYAEGTVNLNPNGTGDIIFTGAKTEADLREMKGGVDGTETEILNSRTSEFVTMTNLYGGRLIVKDKAILKGQGITVAADSGATVLLKDGSLNHSGYAVTFNSGTTLQAERGASITAASVDMESGSTLSFVVGTENTSEPILTLTGTLKTDKINISVSGIQTQELGSFSYALLRADNYDTSLWTKDNINIVTKGISFDSFSWNNGMLILSYVNNPKTVTWVGRSGVWSVGSSMGGQSYEEGDDVIFRTAAAVTITGAVEPGEMLVDSAAAVKFTANAKTLGSGIIGKGTLTKNGAGMLTLNAGNRYSGGTVLNEGTIKATAADSFGTGAITVNGGTLDLASKAVANDIVLAGSATLKGDAKYVGDITVDGNATLQAKTANKSLITIGSGNTLNLAAAATVAGSLDVAGGRLNIAADKGLTIAKGMSLTLNGGTVRGLVNVGAGSVLDCTTGTLLTAPTLSGGTLTTGGTGTLTLSGTGAMKLGTQTVTLKSKGEIHTDRDLTITDGKVTLAGINRYNGAMAVQCGTFSLGKVASTADIAVTGSAALNNGTLHSGDINVSGELIKGTAIKLTRAGQRVNLNHAGVMSGTISGTGIVNVNANIDASLGKLTNSVVNLNSGTLTNAKGMKLVSGQTLTFNGGNMNLAGKVLTTAAGSALYVEKSATVSGALTLGGGALVLEDGANLSVSGALTLSKATTLTLDGTATLTFGTLTAPKKGTLEDFFGVGRDITITRKGNTLTFVGYSAAACAAPETEEFEVVAAAAPEGEVIIITPETVGAPALAVSPAAELAKKAVAERPLGDALVMADWGIVDANRTFTNTLQSRRDSGVLLADGQGMAWASAMGGVSRHGSENGHNGADVNMSGAAVGVEHTAGANSVLGLAVGHTWSRIGATGMQHLRQNTAHVALYGQTKLAHGFTAEWSAAYGDTDSKGTFNGTRETWSQKSTALSARLNKTHELNDTTAVRGFAGINYDATDAASIHGMHTGSIQRLQGEVGAGITHRADKLTTYAEASVTTDFARNAPAVDFGAWRQNGATPGRTGLNLTLGAAYELTDKWSVNAAYHMEAAERNTQHTLNIGAGRKF